MKLRDLKDWEIARAMFGKNTKVECHLVKTLRKNYVLTPHCDGYYILTTPTDEIGWLIEESLVEV